MVIFTYCLCLWTIISPLKELEIIKKSTLKYWWQQLIQHLSNVISNFPCACIIVQRQSGCQE